MFPGVSLPSCIESDQKLLDALEKELKVIDLWGS